MNDSWKSQRTQAKDYKVKAKCILGHFSLHHQSFHCLYEISNHISDHIFTTSFLRADGKTA